MKYRLIDKKYLIPKEHRIWRKVEVGYFGYVGILTHTDKNVYMFIYDGIEKDPTYIEKYIVIKNERRANKDRKRLQQLEKLVSHKKEKGN